MTTPPFVESWSDLPRASGGVLQERVWFDVKATYAPGKRAEMAKDVAAFANAIGGVLIVGASEGPSEPDYSAPLSSQHAAALEHDFDYAVRDYCRPSPTVHVRTIAVPNMPGRAILAANVEPFVDQPVGARHADDPNMWRFPLRVGRHTEYLLPEQLPLHMNSKARRAKLLLLRALDGDRTVDLFTVPGGFWTHTDIQSSFAMLLESVDADGGGAIVLRDPSDSQAATIPLDDVEAVWLQHTSRWALRVAGRFEHFNAVDGSSTNELSYTPQTTFVVSPLGSLMKDLRDNVRDVGRAIGGTLLVQHFPRVEPNEQAIAEVAHQLWTRRTQNGIPGSAEGDWSQARRMLLAQQRTN